MGHLTAVQLNETNYGRTQEQIFSVSMVNVMCEFSLHKPQFPYLQQDRDESGC